MKKIYFLIAVLITLTIGVKAQQSFEFSYEGTVIEDTLKRHVVSTGAEEVVLDYIHFKNITSEPIEVRVYRQDIMLNPTASLFMCFNEGCAPDTIPGDTITLMPNIEYTEFDLMYTYTSDASSLARIHLVDPTTLQSIQSFVVQYKNFNISLGKPINSNVTSLEAYPNPAKNSATINYSIPSNYRTGNLVVRNMIGSVVKTIPINGGSTGKQSISTYDLPNGVYFYSIVGDGKTLSTKKLVVKH